MHLTLLGPGMYTAASSGSGHNYPATGTATISAYIVDSALPRHHSHIHSGTAPSAMKGREDMPV